MNIISIKRQALDNVLVLFRRKNVKPESQTTAKHKDLRLVPDPQKNTLPGFLKN